MISKLREIVTGWKNVVFPNKESEQMAFERAAICAGCPHNINNTCEKCGCPLAAKTRSPQSKCPMGKW